MFTCLAIRDARWVKLGLGTTSKYSPCEALGHDEISNVMLRSIAQLEALEWKFATYFGAPISMTVAWHSLVLEIDHLILIHAKRFKCWLSSMSIQAKGLIQVNPISLWKESENHNSRWIGSNMICIIMKFSSHFDTNSGTSNFPILNGKLSWQFVIERLQLLFYPSMWL